MAETRKLAAILATDVVGYSRLTGSDEDRTLARLRSLRSDLIDPTIAVHNGRVVKRTGDGNLVEFRSVVDAVRCAIELQNGMVERNTGVAPERRIELRVGLHLGDVVEEDDGDLMGDGVNIAARLESIAKPGSICLSEDAFRQVKSRLDLAVTDLGPIDLKNIAEPVRVYSLAVNSLPGAKQIEPTKRSTPKKLAVFASIVFGVVALIVIAICGVWYFHTGQKQRAIANTPAHLSIGVLPFANLSGDPAQDYFADGVTENLTTDLSRIRGSFVIARATAFTYKGKNVDAKSVGTELGVRYVLEGSVQRDGNRVRVNVQLIDAETGAHLWADRFEEDFADLFKLQDKVVARIANSLRIELVDAESHRTRPQNPDAVDLTMRGWDLLWHSQTRETNRAALEFFEQAVKLDPTNAEAHGGLAYSRAREFANGWDEAGADYGTLVIGAADRALAINPSNGMAAYAKGLFLALSGRAAEAKTVVQAALQHNPNLAPLYQDLGLADTASGEYEQAKADIKQALRLSPSDAQVGFWELSYARADLALGHYAEAIDEAHRAIDDGFTAFWPHEVLAAAYALSGKDQEAKAELAETTRVNPEITSIKLLTPLDAGIPRLVEGLRKAGMPEE